MLDEGPPEVEVRVHLVLDALLDVPAGGSRPRHGAGGREGLHGVVVALFRTFVPFSFRKTYRVVENSFLLFF